MWSFVCGTESDFCYTAVSVWTGHGTVPLPEVEQCVRSADAGGEGRPATAQQLWGETVLPQIHQLRQPVVRHTHTWPRSHCDLQRFLFLRVCWLGRGDVITQIHCVITWCTRRLLLLIHSNCKSSRWSLWLTWFWRALIKSFILLFLTALQRTIQKGQSTKSFWWVPVSCWKPHVQHFLTWKLNENYYCYRKHGYIREFFIFIWSYHGLGNYAIKSLIG